MRDWLSHRVEATPNATALVRAPTGETWDYAELDAAVEETAGRLAALGIGAGDHLGIVSSTRVDSVRLVYAAMRLGATIVPLSDRLTAHELERRIERVDLTALVCEEDTESQAVEAAGDVPVASVDDPAWERVHSIPETGATEFESAVWTRNDTLLLLFTSGTTGTPKAVVLRLGNVLSNAIASAFRLGMLPDDRWLVPLSMHHMGGIGPVLRGPLYGTTVILRESFEAGPTADDIDKYDATGVSLVPTMLRRMLDARGTLSDSLRIVLLGGAPARTELIQRCRDYSVPVYPTYGMTETASQIATATPEEVFERPGTVGRPLFWTDLSVVDEAGEEVDAGTVGELVVSGPMVSPGYYGDSEATERAFGPHGLRTGDAGYRDEAGYLYVLNRVDDRIVTGGENVDPGEVVTVLRSHRGIEDAVVVGLPDEEWGERVAALLVPTPDADDEPTREEVEAFCRDRLAGFKLPRTIGFADELPRTDSGTVERETVRTRLASIQDAERVDIPDAERVIEDEPRTPNDDGEPDDLDRDESDNTDTQQVQTNVTDETEGRDEMAAGTGAETEVDPTTEARTETGMESETGPEPETGSETETGAQTATRTGTETGSATEADDARAHTGTTVEDTGSAATTEASTSAVRDELPDSDANPEASSSNGDASDADSQQVIIDPDEVGESDPDEAGLSDLDADEEPVTKRVPGEERDERTEDTDGNTGDRDRTERSGDSASEQ